MGGRETNKKSLFSFLIIGGRNASVRSPVTIIGGGKTGVRSPTTINKLTNLPAVHQLYQTIFIKKGGKVFNGQEPPSGESTTTECGVNYQLLAVI